MHIRRADAVVKGLRDACPHGFPGNLFEFDALHGSLHQLRRFGTVYP